jgi:hemerythrin-like domain-containing protein
MAPKGMEYNNIEKENNKLYNNLEKIFSSNPPEYECSCKKYIREWDFTNTIRQRMIRCPVRCIHD